MDCGSSSGDDMEDSEARWRPVSEAYASTGKMSQFVTYIHRAKGVPSHRTPGPMEV